jgi:hypothetical protein
MFAHIINRRDKHCLPQHLNWLWQVYTASCQKAKWPKHESDNSPYLVPMYGMTEALPPPSIYALHGMETVCRITRNFTLWARILSGEIIIDTHSTGFLIHD